MQKIETDGHDMQVKTLRTGGARCSFDLPETEMVNAAKLMQCTNRGFKAIFEIIEGE